MQVHCLARHGSLCGESGSCTQKLRDVTCRDCLVMFSLDVQDRKQAEREQAEIDAILAMRVRKQTDRIKRREQIRADYQSTHQRRTENRKAKVQGAFLGQVSTEAGGVCEGVCS